MSNTRLYPVFCLERNIEINDLPKMIDWAYANAGSQTVVILNEEEVRYYQSTGLWGIISEEIDNWLFGLHEDDWIFDFDIMQNIINAINSKYIKIDQTVSKILFILDYAIANQKSVVFYL